MKILNLIENQINKTRTKSELVFVFVVFLLFYNLYIKFFQIILFLVYRIQNPSQSSYIENTAPVLNSLDFYYTLYTVVFYAILQEVLFRLPLASKVFKNMNVQNKFTAILGLSTISALLFYFLNPTDGFINIFVDSVVFGFFTSVLFLILNKRLSILATLLIVILFNLLISFKSYLMSIFI